MRGVGYPVISFSISMAKRRLDPGPNFISGRGGGGGLASASCDSLHLIFLSPPFSCCSVGSLFPGNSGTILGWYWNNSVMTTLLGWKFPPVIVLISISNRVHLTGRALVNNFWHLSLKSVLMSHKRASGIDGFYIACALRREFTYYETSIIMFISYTSGCELPGLRKTVKNTAH